MGKMKLKKKSNGLRGETPMEPRLWAELVVEKRPSDQWMAMNQESADAGTAPTPGDEDMIVGLNVYGHMALPSKLLPVKLWKQGKTLLVTMFEAPYAAFRAACEQDIARQLQEAPGNHTRDLIEVGQAALAADGNKEPNN